MATGTPADDAFLQKLHSIIQAKMSDTDFGVNELAHEMGMSRSNLHRRVSEITGKTVVALISEARLKKAMELLKEKTYTVSEISWKAGFGSATYFDKCFHDYFGYPPGEAAKHGFSENSKNAQQEAENQPKSNKKKILLGGIVLLVLVAVLLVIVLVKPLSKKTENLPKTIAVLPFINDSQDTTNAYFINGVMEGIINNLSKIHDLTVLSRTSVEQYRNNKTKSIKQIAKELDVTYIVEGSGQKYGDKVKLFIQLLEAETDKHLMSEQYDRNWEDVFTMQSEIATLVADKIESEITPEEAEIIEKIPTISIQAYNMRLLALELMNISQHENNLDYLRQAEVFQRRAIQFDSTFSQAYIDLAWTVINLRYNIDSGLYLVNRSLHFDNKDPYALGTKGWILMQKGLYEEAEEVLNLAIKYNPNNPFGYNFIGHVYWVKGEFLLWMKSKLKCLRLLKGSTQSLVVLKTICTDLNVLGFYDGVSSIGEEIIKMSNDSLYYFRGKIGKELTQGDYLEAFQTAMKFKNWDEKFNPSKRLNNWESYYSPQTLIWCSLFLKDFKKSLQYVEEFDSIQMHHNGKIVPDYISGYVYLKNGNRVKSDFHFKESIKYYDDKIKNDKVNPTYYYYLSNLYSAAGNKEKSLENLKETLKYNNFIFIYLEIFINYKSPVFDTIRDEPEFQEYLKNAEEKVTELHAQIRKLLQDEGYL